MSLLSTLPLLLQAQKGKENWAGPGHSHQQGDKWSSWWGQLSAQKWWNYHSRCLLRSKTSSSQRLVCLPWVHSMFSCCRCLLNIKTKQKSPSWLSCDWRLLNNQYITKHWCTATLLNVYVFHLLNIIAFSLGDSMTSFIEILAQKSPKWEGRPQSRILTLLLSVIFNANDALRHLNSLFSPWLRHFLLTVRVYCILGLLQGRGSSWTVLLMAIRKQESHYRTARWQK